MMGRGRPRLYPTCTKCGKSVKPDQAGDTPDTHKRCPVPRGPHKPKPAIEGPHAAKVRRRLGFQDTALTEEERLMRTVETSTAVEIGPKRAKEVMETIKALEAQGITSKEYIGMSPLERARAVLAAKRAAAKNAPTMPANAPGEPQDSAEDDNKGEGLSAKEVQQIIRNTVGSRDRHVIKYDGGWHLTDDPDKGFSGKGYDSPSQLLGEWFKVTGFIRNGEGEVIATLMR